MLFIYIFFNLISAQGFRFPDGFVPPPPKECDTIMNPQDCWGPSMATENICLWDAADGLCSEQSHEDMESVTSLFFPARKCRGNFHKCLTLNGKEKKEKQKKKCCFATKFSKNCVRCRSEQAL